MKILPKLVELREVVWGYDVPSPTVPEYVELHERIQDILKRLDKIIEGDQRRKPCSLCEANDKIKYLEKQMGLLIKSLD